MPSSSPKKKNNKNLPNSHLEKLSIPLKQMELYLFKPSLHVSQEVHLSKHGQTKTEHKRQDIVTAEQLQEQQSSQKDAHSMGFRTETVWHGLMNCVN